MWHKLEKGDITRFMEKFHGFEARVTKIMVETWSNERVKIDGVTHQIFEGLIMEVTDIPQEGINFYRDKKILANAISVFVKNEMEKDNLVKIDTYYDIEFIKKNWWYVLKILIEYITLDPRFDRITMYHFVLLNHFRHGVKISLPFYLYTSMSKSIEGFKKKPVTNPTLH